jgi:hypothetical protein
LATFACFALRKSCLQSLMGSLTARQTHPKKRQEDALEIQTDCQAGVQVDPDKAFAVQIAHEENVVTSSVSYIQCALLYTSSTGERRIRFVACF